MSLTYYFDQHVQGPIPAGLRRLGTDVLTSEDDGMKRAEDDELLERATALGRILVTNDEDFTVIARRWQATGRPIAGIVYMTRQQIPYRQAIEDRQLIAESYTPEEMANRVEYIPR